MTRTTNADHPVFDPDTRRRMQSFDFRAISFERHGYLAEETVGFIKQLAYCRALALGLEPSAEIRRWYGMHAASSAPMQKSSGVNRFQVDTRPRRRA